MQLILIRHGETLWNKEGRVQGISDVELSTAGIEQARLLALSRKDHPIKAIHASPLKSSIETKFILIKTLWKLTRETLKAFPLKNLWPAKKIF